MCKIDGINLKLHYDKEVYIVNIIKTGEKYVHQRSKRLRKQQADKKTGVTLRLDTCNDCGSLVGHGLCVNKNCPSYTKTSEPQL